jgi:hypothetical protein
MKFFILDLTLALFFSLTINVNAAEIFVHSPELGELEFHRLLKSTDFGSEQGQSFVQFLSDKTRLQDLNSVTISESPQQLHAAFQKIQKLPWFFSETEFLIAILEKLSFQELTSEEKEIAFSLFISNEKFREEHQSLFKALTKNLNQEVTYLEKLELNKLETWSRQHELIFIDGKNWSAGQNISRLNHQWVLISNSAYPVVLWGSWENFVHATETRLPFESFCQKDLVLWADLPQMKVTNLGADVICHTELNSPMTPLQSRYPGWYEDHKPLWVTSLAVASVAAVVFAGAHGKQLHFHWPSFKF